MHNGVSANLKDRLIVPLSASLYPTEVTPNLLFREDAPCLKRQPCQIRIAKRGAAPTSSPVKQSSLNVLCSFIVARASEHSATVMTGSPEKRKNTGSRHVPSWSTRRRGEWNAREVVTLTPEGTLQPLPQRCRRTQNRP